jgi:hypothetical protein
MTILMPPQDKQYITNFFAILDTKFKVAKKELYSDQKPKFRVIQGGKRNG